MNYEDKMEALRTSGLLKYEYAFKPQIGLHRTVVKNLHIHYIDNTKLSLSGASYITDENNYVISDDGIPFSSISNIRLSGLINTFKAKGFCNPYDSICTEAVSIDFSPDDYIKLYSLSDFHSQLDHIKGELNEQYGIGLFTNDSMFKYAEIAAEFILPRPLAEYSRAFHVLTALNTDRVHKQSNISTDDCINKWQSCLFKRKCYELYVYDKTKELYETKDIVLSENIIKIELRLPDTYLYQTRIKGNISDLDDNDIQKVFLDRYRKNIVIPFEKWSKTYFNSLNHVVSEYRSKYKRWITELYKYCVEAEINYTIILLDWQDILKCPCIKSLDRRTQARIYDQLESCFGNTSFSLNTTDMIRTIFDAVDNCCHPRIEPTYIYSNKSIIKGS